MLVRCRRKRPWLAEYLRNDSQVIRVGEMELDGSPLPFGASQRSVLGPIRFIEYAEDVNDLSQRHGLHRLLLADDKQGFSSGIPSDIP